MFYVECLKPLQCRNNLTCYENIVADTVPSANIVYEDAGKHLYSLLSSHIKTSNIFLIKSPCNSFNMVYIMPVFHCYKLNSQYPTRESANNLILVIPLLQLFSLMHEDHFLSHSPWLVLLNLSQCHYYFLCGQVSVFIILTTLY